MFKIMFQFWFCGSFEIMQYDFLKSFYFIKGQWDLKKVPSGFTFELQRSLGYWD